MLKSNSLFSGILMLALFSLAPFFIFQPLSARQVLSETRSDSLDLAEFHFTLCLFHSDENQYDSAIWHAENAISLFRNLEDTLKLIDLYHELSLINLDIGIFEESISYNQLALDLAVDIKDTSRIVHHFKDFGVIYFDKKEYEKGVELSRRSTQLSSVYQSIPIKDAVDASIVLAQNLAGLGDLDSALVQGHNTLAILRAYGKPKSFEDSLLYSRSNVSIGRVLLEQGKGMESKSFLMNAYAINLALVDNFELSDNLNLLAKAYFNLRQYDSAEYCFNEALLCARASGSLDRLANVYLELNAFHKFTGNLSSALESQDKYISIRDSITEIRRKRAFDAIEGRYQINKKQHQIELQQTQLIEQRAQNKVNLLVIVGLILAVILIVTVFVFWRYRMKVSQQATLRAQEQKLKDEQTSAVIKSLEDERARIAREIHDGIGQSVSALGLNLHGLNNEKTSSEKLKNSKEIVDNLHSEIRDIAYTLMPQKLEKVGLVETLKDLVYRLNQSGELRASLNAFEVPEKLPDLVVLSLFRILQEIISNITKYANAKNLSIQLVGYEDELSVVIEDDGNGFDLEDFKNSDGNGWNNISYRTELINADLDIDTRNGQKGSTYSINIPYL